MNEITIPNAEATEPVSEKRSYTLREVQDILGISRGTVYVLLRRNLFHYVKIGNRVRVSRKSFDEWLDGMAKEG